MDIISERNKVIRFVCHKTLTAMISFPALLYLIL